jgi:hypothetical protein
MFNYFFSRGNIVMKTLIAACAIALGLAATLPATADTVQKPYNSDYTSNDSQARNVFDRLGNGGE